MGGRGRPSGHVWGMGSRVVAAVLVGLAVANAQTCPAPTCIRQGSGGGCASEDAHQFACDPAGWQQHITTFPGSWYTLGSSLPQKPAIEYLRDDLPCCRHCAWSTGYPIAVEEMMAISPDQAFCAQRTAPGQMSQCYLDCTKWSGDFALLDGDVNGMLNRSEFSKYITDYFVAPAQLYKLYTGGGLSYEAGLSRLDASIVFTFVDIDNDHHVSNDEWQLFRHFIGPILVSKAGPQKSPSDGRPLADGPHGGMFIDGTLWDVWSTNQINVMLEYYLTNREKGFRSSQVREPVTYEKRKVMRDMDIDGSERVSIEEHYFRLFADKDGDGYLSPEEYYKSIYRKSCAPICPLDNCECNKCPAGGRVAADCGGVTGDGVPADNSDGSDLLLNFANHDLDQDGKVSFMERKFVAADSDFSSTITAEEWRLGDFPEIYGPFEGHANCSDTADTCQIDRKRFTYYMAFHECASRGSRAYNKPVSEYPWSASCPLLVQVQIQPPFIVGEAYNTPERKLELERMGYLCWDRDIHSDTNVCLSGYSIKVFDDIAKRLQWTYRPVVLRSDLTRQEAAEETTALAVRSLPPPAISGEGANRAVFEIGLFSSYQMPWRAPEYSPGDFRCSQSLWADDGLIIVKRTRLKEVRVEWAILYMLISPTFVNFVVFIYFLVLATGHIFWFVECKQNRHLFDPSYTQGVLDGMWYSMVTMCTVGYGDKVPMTGLGKMATILWMFFGIISFGVFSGNVSDQIALSALENSIQEPADLSSFDIGVLSTLASPKVDNVDLHKEYGFNPVLCRSLQECKEMLIDRESVTAFIAPHSDILNYFNRSELNLIECGNPLALPGRAFTTDSTASFTNNTVKVCGYSRSVYAAQYLADAVSATMRKLHVDGTARRYKAMFLGQDQPNEEAEGCARPSKYDIDTIIATVVVIFFYFLLITFMRRRRKIAVQKLVLAHLMTAVSQRQTTLTPFECARKYGLRWLEKTRKRKRERTEAKLAELAQLGANDYLIHIAKRLRRMALQQTNEIRNIVHDTQTSRDRVSRLVSSMSWIGLFVSLLLLCLTVALLAVWSRIVRLTSL